MSKKRLSIIPAILFISVLFCTQLHAQTIKTIKADSVKKADTAKVKRAQNVYVELGGAGLFFSANYDARFSKRKDGLGGRIGFGFVSDNGDSFTSIPIQLNYLAGKHGKYFEVGAGAVYVYYKNDYNHIADVIYFHSLHGGSSTVIGTMTFGYRYQPVEGGFTFRGTFNPLFNTSSFYPYGGLSFGYSF